MTERDPALERAWREHSRETPPPALDHAILAAAHRAVGSRPQATKPAEATSPQRWWMPLAAAAAIGTVVVGILQTMPPDTNLVLSEPPASGKLAATAPAAAPELPGATARDAAPPSATVNGGRGPDEAGRARTTAEQKQEAGTLGKEATPAPTVPRRQATPAATLSAPDAKPDALVRETPPASAPVAPPSQGLAQFARPPAPPLPAPAAPAVAPRAEVAAEAARANMATAPEPFPGAAPAATTRSDVAAGAPATRAESARPTDADARRDAAAERGPAAAGAAPSTLGRMAQAPAAVPPAPVRARDEVRESAGKPLAKSSAGPDAQAKARDPDAWIARIRKLRDEGNTADAVRELREFRDAVPDAERRLPADLREWAAGLRN